MVTVLHFCTAFCQTLGLAPYLSSIYNYVLIYAVKQHQMTLGYESLSRKGGQGRIHLLFVSFDFESAFSFRDLLSLY